MHNALEMKKAIVRILETCGVSANKMLVDIGLNRSLLLDMERKGSIPSADKLGLIADYLDVSVDYLLGRTDNPEVNK